MQEGVALLAQAAGLGCVPRLLLHPFSPRRGVLLGCFTGPVFMTLTELKYIVAVAREKHFGKAAEACFVSQPTLSVAIKKLEDELELKLFERSACLLYTSDAADE